MAAQPGSAVLLAYGNQGAQQLGSSVVLAYGEAGAVGSTRITSKTFAPWVTANKTIINLFSPQPATVREDQERAAPWSAAASINNEDVLPHIAAARTDDARAAPWGAFGEMLNEDSSSSWKASIATDDQRSAVWTAFGEAMNEERDSRWEGSKAVDHMRDSAWPGFMIQKFIPVPYERPAANAANFSVIGGGVQAFFPAPGYVPPYGLAINFQFGVEQYTPAFMRVPGYEDFVAPSGNAVNWQYTPQRIPALDEFGQPVKAPGFADQPQFIPWGTPVKRDKEAEHPWLKYSRPLNPGWGIVTPPGPPIPQPGQTITVPVQRVYIVLNEVVFVRVSNTTPIPATALNITFDADSWLPQFSATIPESARDAIMPDPNPVEVGAVINGIEFRFFVERIQRNRQFGQNTINIGGRGIACELDAPYATASQHTNPSTVTAQQIIDAALTNTGYSQTWTATDWSVPANTFSLYGTPAAVAGEVASSIGAVLQADWALKDLRMMPRYPVKPWDWATATPEYVIPGAVTQTESLEWLEKPDYNVVYVSGVQNGVLGQVKITGTAGDKPAQMVTHPLITHIDAARQRGTAILGDTGRKAMMQINLPVLETTGVIDVCRLIEFNDGTTTRRGIVRANNISVNFPTVRQTLTVEAAA